MFRSSFDHTKTIKCLKARLAKLESENAQLMSLFKIIVEVAYQAINKEDELNNYLKTCLACNKPANKRKEDHE